MRKRCNACGEKKPWDDFYAKVKWPDGSTRQPHSRCKVCMKIAKAAWFRALPPEQRRAYYKAKFRALQADPERHAIRMAYERDWHRRRSPNPTPSRWVDGPGRALTGPLVPVAALLPAVRASGVAEVAISLGAGYGDSTVTKALKRESVSLEMAVRILRVLDVAPAEVGL